MKNPEDVYDDPMLSVGARYLFLKMMQTGRVITADEFHQFLPDGLKKIEGWMRELKKHGYIESHKYRDENGQCGTELMFAWGSLNNTPEAFELTSPTGSTPTGSTPTGNRMPVIYIDSSSKQNLIEGLRPSIQVARPAGVKPKEGTEMGWNLDGEENPELSKSQIRRLAVMAGDDVVGAVGRFEETPEQKRSRLNAKYKKTVPERKAANRFDKPEEFWNTHDLVGEFYSLLQQKLPGIPDQANAKTLSVMINKHISEGATRVQLLAAMRAFFNDPRSLREPGKGDSIMHRFFKYWYKFRYKFVEREVVEAVTADSKAQKRMKEVFGRLDGKNV